MHPLSVLCNFGTHCIVCRDPERGAAWRASLRGYFSLPAGWPECPKGYAWGIIERPRPSLGDIPEDYDPKDSHLDSKGSEGCNCGGE